jgi:hypothetical protein
MIEQEKWALGSARATVNRCRTGARITLTGIVTARAYEELHARLATEPPGRLVLIVDDSAVFVVTCKSAVEAAVRGTPAARIGAAHAVFICVPPWRVPWALLHCVLMAEEGLIRVTLVDQMSAAAPDRRLEDAPTPATAFRSASA